MGKKKKNTLTIQTDNLQKRKPQSFKRIGNCSLVIRETQIKAMIEITLHSEGVLIVRLTAIRLAKLESWIMPSAGMGVRIETPFAAGKSTGWRIIWH